MDMATTACDREGLQVGSRPAGRDGVLSPPAQVARTMRTGTYLAVVLFSAAAFGCQSGNIPDDTPACDQWQTPVRPWPGDFVNDLAAADLNGDGKPDLVSANFNNNVGVLINRGDGDFADVVQYPAKDFPEAVTAADLNGDGKP